MTALRSNQSTMRHIQNGERLALTWFERQFRFEIPEPFDTVTPGWELEHERRYGIPFFDDRRELVATVLTLLDSRGIRLSAVNAILRRAKNAQLKDAMVGATLTFTRTHAKRVAQMHQHLDRVAAMLTEYEAAAVASDLPVTAAIAASTSRRVQNALVEDSLLRHYPPGRHRRKRAGRQPRPWVKTARRQLRRIGVRPQECEELLGAVGLTITHRQAHANFSREKN